MTSVNALRENLAVARSLRERLASVLLALSRALPGGSAVWLLMGADIPRRVRIGRRLRLPHGAQGVVIHPDVRIGDDVVINHRVTIGRRHGSKAAPVVGSGVEIGVGAVVLGAVVLGDGCRVGANAVVTKDVPPGAIAVGVPARVLTARSSAPQDEEIGVVPSLTRPRRMPAQVMIGVQTRKSQRSAPAAPSGRGRGSGRASRPRR